MKVHTVTGGSIDTNAYVIEENRKAVVFDFVPEVEDFLDKNGLELEKIFLTHIHFDHIEGLSFFQKKHEFELCLSRKASPGINDPEKNLLIMMPRPVWESIPPVSLARSLFLKDQEAIEWNGIRIEIMDSPGHTQDSCVYILRENRIIFSGDSVFYESIGRTDFPDGNYPELIRSIERLFNWVSDEFVIYPGHGPETTVGQEKRNNPFLNEIHWKN